MLRTRRHWLLPSILLIVCASMILFVSSRQTTTVQSVSGNVSGQSTRMIIVSEDARRSAFLSVGPMLDKIATQARLFANDEALWRLWLSKQAHIAYFAIPGKFIWSQLDSKTQQLVITTMKQTHVSTNGTAERVIVLENTPSKQALAICLRHEPIHHVVVLRLPVLSSIINNSQKNTRLSGFPLPKGASIRSVPAEQTNRQKSHYHSMQIVVKFRRPLADETQQTVLRTMDASILRQWNSTYILQSKKLTFQQMKIYLEKLNPQYIEPHYVYMTNQSALKPIMPNDILYVPYQWNLPLIRAEKGWKMGKGNGKTKIAIIDTGIDLRHPELQAHLLSGYNAIQPGQEPFDDVGHGTHVAGIISAQVNNKQGIAGLSWFNPIIPVKVLDETGSGQSFTVAEGIVWATDLGAKVINLSLGNYARSQFLHDAVRYAYEKDVVLIAAGGNENTDQWSYPAAYPEVLAVSAIDEQKKRAAFSNFGSYIDVAAPGLHIASTFPNEAYAALSGTSMAAPHVSALAAMMRSACPTLRNKQVMALIRSTASDIGPKGRDIFFGHGLINVEKAMKMTKHACAPIRQKTTSKAEPLPSLHVRVLQFFQQIKNPLR